MNYRSVTSFFLWCAAFAAWLPAYTQPAVIAPTKYEMKKDADGDGVKNKRDNCPTTPPGVTVDGSGCPLDRDKDGVADYLDKCPDLPGTTAMNGCQDKDKDGVNDMDDLCPGIPGLARFRGCPDSDGDGVEDAKDKCPNAKGPDMFKGCPDSDGDGVEDALDKCPGTAAGIETDASGCAADSDNDGVPDTNDKCPGTKYGVKVDALGCAADTDGDGVADVNDKCPGVIGDAANNGCPVIKKEVPKRLRFAGRKVNFVSGAALIAAGSYPMLDEVVSILNAYPDYNLRISGHTDAVEKNGGPLSQLRAEAVKSYILGKGIAENRLMVMSYGKTKPVAAGTSSTARAQNRRSEIELYLR